MKKNYITLTLLTPEKQIFQGMVEYVKLTTETGVVKILPHHTSFSASFLYSPLEFVDEKGREEKFVATRGIVNVSNPDKKITILALQCTKKSELTPVTADQYLAFIEEKLKNKKSLSAFQISFLHEEKFALKEQVKKK